MTATDTNIATIHEELCLETDTKEKSEDHWNGCTFCLDITAEAKRPGKLPGEHCTTNEDYQFLYTQFPHWRRLLSHDYMRNTDLHDPISPAAPANPAQLVLLHLDDHAWASVQHYFEASRVKHLPDLYRRFTLDSNDPLGYSPAAQGVEFNKTQETRQVPGEALRRALLAKFVQNEDLGKALVATGGAKLVSQCADGVRTEETLMWVRTVLRREEENVSQAYDPHTAKDKQQEVRGQRCITSVFMGLC
ncbi:hypothetical protein BDF14DRAFT_1102697 [Spinellus fusiger]|nr:hypothetical protein BDF14DRAFT_1102697 [Spinellus fusiger]